MSFLRYKICFYHASLINKFLIRTNSIFYILIGGILDYRLNGKPNPDKTFETPELSGLTWSDCTLILE